MMGSDLKRELILSLTILAMAVFGCDLFNIDGDGDDPGKDDPTYFKVTATHTDGGMVTPSSADVPNKEGGSTKTFRAVAYDGYRFSKWEIAKVDEDGVVGETSESTANPLNLTVEQNMTLNAMFTSTTVNTAPKAYDISVTTTINTQVNVQLSASDEDGDPLNLSLVGGPAHGTLSQSLPLVTYTPAAGYAGPDSFTYKANDGQADSNTATVNISVIYPAAIGWARSFGSSDVDCVNGVATDTSGNLYMVGTFTGTVDFDPGIATQLATSVGQQDMFLVKYSADGTFQWVRTIGSSQNDAAAAVVVATTGNVYLIGTFNGTVFLSNPGQTAPTHTSNGGADVLVAKYNPQGGYMWSRQIGGPGDDYGNAIALSPDGNVVLGGKFTQSVDFNPTEATESFSSAGKSDGFVTKLSSLGEYKWTLKFGGTEEDEITGVACDATYNILVAGNFSSSSISLDPVTGGEVRDSNGGSDMFLVKFQQHGTYVWGKTIGGPADDRVTSLVGNDYGTAYMGGGFQQTVDFNPDAGADARTSGGSTDGFVTAIDATGNYKWTHTMSGTGAEIVNGLAIDKVLDVYAVGTFSGTTDFNPDGTEDRKSPTGSADAFLTKLGGSSSYKYTVTTGGPMDDYAKAVTVFQNSYLVYWGGGFQETADLDPRTSSEMHTSFGNYDCFLIKMTTEGTW
jgi:hypothetical protein